MDSNDYNVIQNRMDAIDDIVNSIRKDCEYIPKIYELLNKRRIVKDCKINNIDIEFDYGENR